MFITSCAHAPHATFDSHLQALRCDQAFESVPQLQKIEKTQDSMEWMVKNTAAYSYVGLNYTAEVLWDVSVGVVGFVVLCLPLQVAATKTGPGNNYPLFLGGGNPPRISNCLPAPGGGAAYFSPPLGRKAYHQTKKFRCPNVTPLAESLEKVALCFEQRKSPEDTKKAMVTLENLAASEDFFSCVDEGVQRRILERHAALKVNITRR